MRAAQIASASVESPVELDVIAEVAAGDVFEGSIAEGQCVRIMTGAPLPPDADSVVKYEVVGVVRGDGKTGSRVSFSNTTKQRSNVREAGEEAKAGEIVVRSGEVIGNAGVGFLAGCGVTSVPVHRRPRVAIISIGSELVDADEVPSYGKIRNSNAYALAACAAAAGAVPVRLPIVRDSLEALQTQVERCAAEYDFVVTSGGASNGDFDFIKPAIQGAGELLMSTVNMRPGKAQAFGVVNATPVFGLPGNPAAAYLGFELLVRPALRKMQGFSNFERPRVKARLSEDFKKKDPRRIFTLDSHQRRGRAVRGRACKEPEFGVVRRHSAQQLLRRHVRRRGSARSGFCSRVHSARCERRRRRHLRGKAILPCPQRSRRFASSPALTRVE